MDNDWDLYAVVKGCTTTTAATTTTTISSSINMVPSPEDPFVTLGYMSPSLDDDTNINFPTTTQDKPVEPFDDLEEFCTEFHVGPATDVPVGQTPVFSSQHHSKQPQEIPQIQQQQMNPFVGCSLSFQTNSQPLRPRRRKNQQMKVVQQMTQEELSADSWAWRKYGQKPIKGSPYPRNYYRCSTSKSCGARKHVERSPTNPAIFMVSYSGEHAHPRPIQRSSLSGTTRTKFSSVTTSGDPTTTSNTSPVCVSNSSCSSSSLASCTSFSPNTPIMEGEKPERNDDFEMVEQLEVEDEDEDILFSNEFMSEEIFKVHQELSGINNGSSGHSSGGDVLSSGLLSPPWSLSSSAAAFNAGGSGADRMVKKSNEDTIIHIDLSKSSLFYGYME